MPLRKATKICETKKGIGKIWKNLGKISTYSSPRMLSDASVVLPGSYIVSEALSLSRTGETSGDGR